MHCIGYYSFRSIEFLNLEFWAIDNKTYSIKYININIPRHVVLFPLALWSESLRRGPREG